MRLPIIPLVVAASLLGAVWYLFTTLRSGVRTLEMPTITRLIDVDGIETEVAVTADGNRLALVASGDLWIVDLAAGTRRQITETPVAESFPAWMPDGKRITYTRGSDTFSVDPDQNAEEPFRSNATSLSWSSAGGTAFVRDRALWITAPNDSNETKLVDADMTPDIDIHSPRFSPDALQVAFIKTQLGLRGEVWVADVLNGMVRPLVADRVAENPLDTCWINNGLDLAYLTNRAGAYSIWYVDLRQSTINPLTQPLDTVPLGRIGMAVSKERILLPRHFVASSIALSDGTTVVKSEKLLFQPAVSPDGNLVAYTMADENKWEIWTASIKGGEPMFRTLGRQPRFSANGLDIVYTHQDLTGNDDIWRFDVRNGSAERVTDADEIDLTPDSSPDGRSIAFASARAGAVSIWTIPESGGKRLRINDGGYAPRFSPDSKSILFWRQRALWTMDADGMRARQAAGDVPEPIAGVWSKSEKGPAFFVKPPVNYPVWPGFDVLPDGRFVVAPIDIRETGLWSIDLTYKEN
jgi:Tol biopolymer transport system component